MMLIDLAIKATVLLAVGFGFGILLRHASAASRHTVWTTVFVAMLLLPVARFVMPEWAVISVPDRFSRLNAASVETAAAVGEGLHTGATTAGTSPALAPWRNAWRSGALLVAVWAVGAAGYLLWIAAGWFGTRRLERVARLVEDDRVRERAARAAAFLGVRRPVRLLAVSNEVMPSTWGLRTPRVLLPGKARHWTDTQLDAVLTHELSHVVRRDAASHLSARLATALWWWHPLIWVAARRARFERERACDDLVLTQGTCASDYAADLVTFVTSLRLPLAESPATLAMARRSQLEGRVMAILKSDVNRRGVSQSGFMAALLVMALVWPLAAARPAEPGQDPVQAPLRVGGQIQPPTKVKDVRPVYPAAAQVERRQGIVIVEAVIDTDGTVADAKVIRSIGEDLDAAALDAVLQWEFKPTTLNGRSVQLIMTVTVNFVLDSDMSVPPPPPPPDPPAVGAVPPPPPPPPPPGALTGEDQPVRVGGAIKPPEKIKDVKPIYPLEAQQARVSGVVILEVRIDAEGNVADARVIRSVAGLDDAARDAVLQWKFTPTTLNGVPVPVIMTMTVNFTLQ